MERSEVVSIIYNHVNTHEFPKTCPYCGRVFHTLKEFNANTTQIGKPVSYDAEFNEWAPESPIGTMAFSNCSCGSTISVSSAGMPVTTLLRLMVWARVESLKQGITVSELLYTIRAEVDQKALEDEE